MTIAVFSRNYNLAADLGALLKSNGIPFIIGNPSFQDTDSLALMYQNDVVAVVADAENAQIPQEAWMDMLTSLGRRIPVVVVGPIRKQSTTNHESRSASMTITRLEEPSPEEVMSVLDACGAIGIDFRRLNRDVIPIYNPQVPLHMLQNFGALSILMIDASSFRKISIEYGSEVYHRVQECFNQILFDQWGTAGSFRANDVLCRRSVHSNTYYIFLEQSRASHTIPAPGILEKLSDRLAIRLQNAFWREIFVERSRRIMPDCIKVVPDIAIGFGTSIYNPCVDSIEVIELLLETAVEESRIQLKRMRDRQRELMQTLIQTPGLLEPHYQAVFQLPNLTKTMVESAASSRSIKPLMSHLYGFESLIRVRGDAIDALYDVTGPIYMESRYLRPDVLFALSHSAKVGLELDQACLQQAVKHSMKLPGSLLLNILPRNLYNIDRLRPLLKDRKDIMFEVSESEAISNIELMIKVRDSLSKMDMRIAADDFGKGYNGLEQIIRMRPDLIKLDRSLIQDIHNDPPKQAFVHGLVRAAQISKSTILAEGVELWEEAEVLQSMGIDLIQGFLLHRPQSVSIIELDILPSPAPSVLAA